MTDLQLERYDNRFMYYFLSDIVEIGSAAIGKLDEHFDQLSTLLYIKETELKECGLLDKKQIDSIVALRESVSRVYDEYRRMNETDIRFITFNDAEYPQRLKNIHTPPRVLFVKGELPSDEIPSVAIVGSRSATNYGIQMTEYVAEALADEGISIVSGLAAGIDAAAHRGSIRAKNGNTYAVVGTGVNVCYPKQNYYLFKAMAEEGRGGVISELMPGLNPLAWHFPMRNRIISGLSDIVLVAEAREKSGSLITAEFALQQNRDLMAIPGRVTDPMSVGCNQLISQGAGILLKPDDVICALGLIRNKELVIHDENINSLAKDEKMVYSTLDLHPKYIEEIVDDVRLEYSDVVRILFDLEIKGYITQFSGNYYGITKKFNHR